MRAGWFLPVSRVPLSSLCEGTVGGSAAVLGAARAIAELQPEGVEIHFIVASCENMIAGKAMRPGDVLTAANGKTVEVRCCAEHDMRHTSSH